MYQAHGKGACSVATAGAKRRVHVTFDNGTEMVEEYDAATFQLLVRKWKQPSTFGRERDWEYEIGEPPEKPNSDSIGLFAGAQTPIFRSFDHTDAWEWQISNLPYPENVYQLSVDEEKQEIILRTSNKKYFKRFAIPCLIRLKVPLESTALDLSHSNTTLTIQYEKPHAVKELEDAHRRDILRRGSKEGDVDCKQQ